MTNAVLSFEDSTIWSEVQDIIYGDTKRSVFDYKGTLHTEKEDLPLWDLNEIEIVRDYVHDIGETARLFFKVGMGDYVKRIYPYRQNLEFTLQRMPMVQGGSVKDEDLPTTVLRYKAIFNAAMNPPVGGSDLEAHAYSDLNTDLVEVKLELVNRSLEPLRIMTTGGAYPNKSMEELVRAVLSGESLQLKVDGKPSIDGIDIVKPDNQEPVSQVIFPHGTPITSVPTYLHESVGGIYNGGIGTYFQQYQGKKLWFVYPLYSADRFDGKDKRVVFYVVPQEKLPQLDKSYRTEGSILKVAVTAQRKYSDSAELAYMNAGSGYRMADARSFMKKPVKIGKNGPEGNRGNLNHEVAITDRKDGLNYAPVVKGGPSSNPFFERSKILALSMAQIDFVWENADPELLYPGMPCKYVYLSGGKPVSLKGTILFVHSYASRLEKYKASAFRTTCRVTIATEPQTKTPDLPATVTPGEN